MWQTTLLEVWLLVTKIFDLMPRLIQHNQKQAEYYQRQLASTERELGRLMMIDSGQLMLWDEPLYAQGTVESHFLRRANYGYIERHEEAPREEAGPDIQ